MPTQSQFRFGRWSRRNMDRKRYLLWPILLTVKMIDTADHLHMHCRVEWGNSDHSEKKSPHLDRLSVVSRRKKVIFSPQVDQPVFYRVLRRTQRFGLVFIELFHECRELRSIDSNYPT